MARILITWKKSAIGFPNDQRGTIRSLGLRRLHQTVVKEDSPSVRGMVYKVNHLVEVSEEPCSGSTPPAVANPKGERRLVK